MRPDCGGAVHVTCGCIHSTFNPRAPSSIPDVERAAAWKAAAVARAKDDRCWTCGDIATKTTGTPKWCDEHAAQDVIEVETGNTVKYDSSHDLPGAEEWRAALALDGGIL